jgi:hypothetical protein
MKLKLICLTFILSSAIFAQTKIDKITQLLDLTGSENTINVMKTQFKNVIKNASPDVPSVLMDSLFVKLDKKGLYSITIPIYNKNLDEETIDGLIAFYKSKAGKAFVSKMPVIMQESMQAGAVWGQNIMTEIISEIKKRGYTVQDI